jgi:hypothetical protein
MLPADLSPGTQREADSRRGLDRTAVAMVTGRQGTLLKPGPPHNLYSHPLRRVSINQENSQSADIELPKDGTSERRSALTPLPPFVITLRGCC